MVYTAGNSVVCVDVPGGVDCRQVCGVCVDMQASLGLGQSLKECLAKVYELPVGKPAQDALLKAAIPFVVTLAVDADSIKVRQGAFPVMPVWRAVRGMT